jgi:LysR family transcriptional activator of nhaA
MDWLNYHHLLYFWHVARLGSVSAAARELHVTQPTVSAQIRSLEEQIGEKLFRRAGRGLALTETGRLAFRYAEEIFTLGRELVDSLSGRPTGGPVRFNVGVADVVPKLVAHRLLSAASASSEPLHLVGYEGKPTELLLRLAAHELDLVISDAPVGSDVQVKAFNHRLGESGITIFAPAKEAPRYRRRFPQSLEGAPFLLPTSNTTLRRSLDQWFERTGVRPAPVAEFEDSALMKVFAQAGDGLFAGPTVIEREIVRQYRVRPVGREDSVKERFYAISAERRIRHPGVAAIAESARDDLFA